MKSIKLALHWQMIIALLLGATGGLTLGAYYHIWGEIINGISNLFLNAINMIVIPLVFLSTLLGISKMSNSKAMGRIAAKTFLYFFITAFVAAIIAIMVTGVLRPGYGACCSYINADKLLDEADKVASGSFMAKIVAMIPSNVCSAFANGEILSIIFFSLIFGFFITKISENKRDIVNGLFDSFHDIIMEMTNFIIRFAPIGVWAIVMNLVGKMSGDVDSLARSALSFALFILVLWLSLIVMGGIILPIMVGVFANTSPLKHLKQIYSALMIAFSTGSSYSALPLLISTTKENIGVSNNIVGFTVPLGITFNKVGTVIYECAAVIFIAQALDMELTFVQQMSLIGVTIVTVLGAPSVPMAGVVVLAVLLKAMDLPNTFIGMFMAIDILCDMPKTMLNAYSVGCSAIIVARSEGEKLKI